MRAGSRVNSTVNTPTSMLADITKYALVQAACWYSTPGAEPAPATAGATSARAASHSTPAPAQIIATR